MGPATSSRGSGASRLLRSARPPQTYAESTHASPFWIVRYAHQQRAAVAVEMMLATRPAVVVDWGTGDGLVIEQLLDQSDASLELVIAFEPGQLVRQLAERLAAHPLGGSVVVCETVAEVDAALGDRKIDVLACLGVLEHLPLSSRTTYYDVVRRHLAPDGSLVIDVPVEVGPALIVKELGRRVLKRRAPEYRLRDLARRAIGITSRDPDRFDPAGSTDFIVPHRGFDHRHLIAEVVDLGYTVTERRNTPVRWAPSWAFNQEVIFRAVPASAPARSSA